jgi:hypothetical protein
MRPGLRASREAGVAKARNARDRSGSARANLWNIMESVNVYDERSKNERKKRTNGLSVREIVYDDRSYMGHKNILIRSYCVFIICALVLPSHVPNPLKDRNIHQLKVSQYRRTESQVIFDRLGP